ncbi:hypothetical protein Btru_034053 [Bulinus truncatus]|nr:hypothetical protein Btru_034053 [Bulinus truncatus]
MEIPIIHETTCMKSGTPVSAPLLVSSTLPATNHFFHSGSGRSVTSQRSLQEGDGLVDMHREEVIVTTSYKPKTPAKPNLRKGENDSFRLTQRSLHTRLPSADSGIQADGGFDSLSRYRGKTFLSASSAGETAVTDESVSSSSATQSTKNSSGGFSGGQPQQKLPLVSRVVSLPSKSFFTTSATNATPSTSPRSSSASQVTTSAVKAPVPAVRTSLTSLHNASKSLESRSEPSQTTPSTNGASASEALDSLESPAFTELKVTSTSSNQNSNTTASKTVSNRKQGSSVSITNQSMDLSSQTNHTKANSDQNVPIKILPNVKVVSNPGVKIAVNKNTVNITQTKTAPPSANDVVTFQMVHPARAGQPDANKNRGPGCIALTRPLRLGAPPAPSAARNAPSVNSQPPTNQHQAATPQARGQPPPLPSQPPRVITTNSSVRVKPKIAPRPSIAPKPSPQSSPSKTSTGESKTAAPSSENGISSDSTHNKNKEIKVVTEIPVTYRPSTPGSQPSRIEIPVKHIETSAQTCVLNITKPTSLGTTSLSRFTPERQLHQRQSMYERLASEREKPNLHKFPIYENVFNIKDGFSFDDPSCRMRQAELILKQSDELINDALKMLGTSPSPLISPKQSKRNGFTVDVREFPDGERVVEGSDASPAASSEHEHHVPIFDVQSGKMYCGGPRAAFSDGTGVASAGTDNKVKDVIWNERKNRIDASLSWLKTELASLREMDNTLISHFKRCQETIDALKTQRDVWDGLSEEGEDGEYWDDYEITEFNKKYLDSPGGSESSHLSPNSRDPSLQDVSSISIQVPQLHLPQSSPDQVFSPSQRRGSVTQDVEAIL